MDGGVATDARAYRSSNSPAKKRSAASTQIDSLVSGERW
jgi:hypothetical protein